MSSMLQFSPLLLQIAGEMVEMAKIMIYICVVPPVFARDFIFLNSYLLTHLLCKTGSLGLPLPASQRKNTEARED